MRSIYVVFQDEDFTALESCKGELGWRDAILRWSGVKK